MIVVDTNVIAYLYLPCEYTAAAEDLLAEDPHWAAPVLWRSEFRNVLVGYLRRGALTFEQVAGIQSEAEDLLREGEYDVDSLSVLDAAAASDCSAYDCEFVALARRLDTKLATMDAKILAAYPQVAVALAAR